MKNSKRELDALKKYRVFKEKLHWSRTKEMQKKLEEAFNQIG